MVMSKETDILIVGYNHERFAPEIRTAFRHWQVYNVAAPHALHGRRFTRAYVTEGAIAHPSWWRINSMLVAACEIVGGEVLPFSQYVEPEPEDNIEDAVLVSQLRRNRHSQDWV